MPKTTARRKRQGLLSPIFIPKDELLALKSFLSSSRSLNQKYQEIKKVYGGVRVICGKIPTRIITYDVNGASVIERYCDKCIKLIKFR